VYNQGIAPAGGHGACVLAAPLSEQVEFGFVRGEATVSILQPGIRDHGSVLFNFISNPSATSRVRAADSPENLGRLPFRIASTKARTATPRLGLRHRSLVQGDAMIRPTVTAQRLPP